MAYRVAYGPHTGQIPAVLSVVVVRLGNTSVFRDGRKVRLDTPPTVKGARIVPVSLGVVDEDGPDVDGVVSQTALEPLRVVEDGHVTRQRRRQGLRTRTRVGRKGTSRRRRDRGSLIGHPASHAGSVCGEERAS